MCNHRWGLWVHIFRQLGQNLWPEYLREHLPGLITASRHTEDALWPNLLLPVLLIWYRSADACPYSLVSSLSSWMTYYLAQIYFSLSFQTTTEKRPLVTKSSTAASNQTGSASRNTSAAPAASKTTAPVRTAGSTRTTTTAAAKKPLGMCVAFFTLGLFIYCVDKLHDWQRFKHFLFSL